MNEAAMRRYGAMALGAVACLGMAGCRGDSAHQPESRGVSAQHALSQADLEAAVLPGGMRIGSGTHGVGNGTVHAVAANAASPTACVPVLAAADGASTYQPAASVTRMMDSGTNSLTVNLATYSAKAAQHAMTDLRDALHSCRRFSGAGAEIAWTQVHMAHQWGEGEQELAFRSQVRVGAAKDNPSIPSEAHVIRVGSTLATFTTQNLTGTSATPTVSHALVHRQITALMTRHDD